MKESNNTYLLLMMAGSGKRLDKNYPKQYHIIENKPIFIHLLDQLVKIDEITEIIIVNNSDFMDTTKKYIDCENYKKIIKIVPGGTSRSESILLGLREVKKVAKDDDVILMYDATHPLVDKNGVKKVIETINEVGGATLAETQLDTIYKIDKENKEIVEVLDRNEIVSGGSPEGLKFKIAYDIYTNTDIKILNKMTSAGALAKYFEIPFKTIPMNDVFNLKITYPKDIEILKKVIRNFK